MEINDNIIELISELEYIIANSTIDNAAFIGNGVTTKGYFYRYPVWLKIRKNFNELPDEPNVKINNEYKVHNHKDMLAYYDENHNLIHKTRNITPDEIKTMQYKFGKYRLLIGDGLTEILQFLENRYNIDFNELEEKIHSSHEK